SPQGRKRYRSSFQDKFGKSKLSCEHREDELLPSHLQEGDGNMAMSNAFEDPQVRHTQSDKRRVKWNNEDCIHVTVWRDTKPPEREMRENTQDGTMKSWFRVTFHYIRNQARFFVQNASTSTALKEINYRICDEESRKIFIFVSPSDAPYSVQNKLKPEQMEQLKVMQTQNTLCANSKTHLFFPCPPVTTTNTASEALCPILSLQLTMDKRYDVFHQALNLKRLRFDPDNKLYQLDGLSDITEKAPRVKILNLSKNELKSVRELDKVKGLKLQELWLEGNPLCRTFPDRSAYVSAIRDCFPKLLCLDGQELLIPVITDMETTELFKPCMESYKGSEMLKNLVLQFLQQYFLIYDSGDRQGLLDAYHDEACFSLTIPFNPENPGPSLCEYFNGSRKHKNPYLQRQLLKHTKCDIVNTLNMLPKTQHDLSSFLVDMWFHTEMMVCFSVNGVFKEVEGNYQGCIHAFTRTFTSTLASNSRLYIMNDELIVRNASSKETQSAYSIPVPTPCSSYVPALSQEQQEMVQTFSTQSGMNLEWSQKCLQDNEWDYTRAGQVFTMFQTESKIPEEAFKQIP
ncbi:Nuclear RNA export factor 2, partial [Tupaia chinensis]